MGAAAQPLPGAGGSSGVPEPEADGRAHTHEGKEIHLLYLLITAQPHEARVSSEPELQQLVLTVCVWFQAQCAALQRQKEHSECCSELQRVCAQLQRAQERLHSQQLELERLRPVEKRLGQNQREQQVSGTAEQQPVSLLQTH